jgi:acetyltransferase-like isoleucine patch superfamily enzyme
VVGAGTSIGANATVDGAVIGRRCRIQSGARLFTGCVLDDEVFVGPNVVICNDFFPRTDKTGFYPNVYKQRAAVWIERGASIGANVTILPGVRIGRHAMIAAGSVVRSDVPDWTIHKADGSGVPIDRSKRVERMRYVEP